MPPADPPPPGADPPPPSERPGGDPAPRLRRILPEHAELTPTEAIAGLGLGGRAPPERPYLVLNMVATADGKAALGGRTKGLSGPTDRRVFRELRTQADAVMVGAGTARTERYGPLVRDPALREKRRREGLAPDPLACLVSGRLDLPGDLPLLRDPDSRVVVLTASRAALPEVPARVEYLREPGAPLHVSSLLGRLRGELGVRSVLCEGGPTLNASLLREGLVDELFLTLSPMLIGGARGLTIVAGEPLPAPVELELLWLLESGGHLFLRLRVRR